MSRPLAARDRAHDHKRRGSRRDRFWQRRIRRFVGEILLAGKESHERATLLGHVVANGSAQHWITRLQSIEHRALRDPTRDLQFYLPFDARQLP